MNTGILTIHRVAAPFIILVVGSSFSIAAEPASVGKDWAFETILLKNGYTLKGLILEETADCVRFQHVRRVPGRPTVSMTYFVPVADISKIEKLPNEEHELLKNRLKELDQTGEGELRRMESLELQICDWNDKSKKGWRYDSDFFSLISNAPEDVVRRSAVRLEQIYIAYVQFLPPRFPGGKATTIVLYPSLDEYRKMLDKQGWTLKNPAFFDPESNRIFCGSNLVTLGEDLKRIRLQHKEDRAKLDQREADIRQHFKRPQELARYLEPVQNNRKRMADADRYNDSVFDNETKRLFTILYHESFHAYVSNFVYPPTGKNMPNPNLPGELPRWLNEGLAQIFETAIVEAGELRVGHADKERLPKVKEMVRKCELMPIKELLNSGPKAFLVQHGDDRLASDRAYLTSWALAAYLTFDRRLLGTPQLDAFVKTVNDRGEAEEALKKLTGQKHGDFEKDFHAWLQKIPTEGSLVEPIAQKGR